MSEGRGRSLWADALRRAATRFGAEIVDLLKTGNLLHQLIRRFPLCLQMGLQFHDARGMTGPFRNLLGQLLGTMLLIGQSRLQFADPVHLSRDSIPVSSIKFATSHQQAIVRCQEV